jgi:hypothetical protein
MGYQLGYSAGCTYRPCKELDQYIQGPKQTFCSVMVTKPYLCKVYRLGFIRSIIRDEVLWVQQRDVVIVYWASYILPTRTQPEGILG